MTPTSQTWYQVIDVESSLAGEYSSSEEWVDPRAAGPHVSAYYSRIGPVTGRDTFREPVVLYCFTISYALVTCEFVDGKGIGTIAVVCVSAFFI
jgi:hypothetical protein